MDGTGDGTAVLLKSGRKYVLDYLRPLTPFLAHPIFFRDGMSSIFLGGFRAIY